MGEIVLFGPVSSATATNTAGGNIVFGVFVSLLVCWLLFEMWRSRRRLQRLRKAVELNHWDWLGSELPSDFPLRDLANVFNRPIEVENAFCGQWRGLSFLSCDCVIGEGRHKHWFSIIAAHTDKNPFGAERFDPGLSIVEAQGWFAVKRTERAIELAGDRTFSADEVIGHIESVG